MLTSDRRLLPGVLLLLLPIVLVPGAAVAADPRRADSAFTPQDTLATLWRLEVAGTLAPHGEGRGQVLEPSGVVADAFGRVVVADAALHRVQRFAPDGRVLGEAGTLGSEPGQLRQPGSVVMLGTLTVAVLDRENRRVESYDSFGRRLGTVVDLQAASLTDAAGRVEPVAMTADRGGALYVADAERDRILAFDFSGRFLRAIGGLGTRPGSFRGLSGLAAAADGGLIVAERVNARVQRLDAAGRATVSWPLAVARQPGMLAVAADDSGRVAVADEPAGRVWVFDRDGRTMATLGGLARPRALAFAPDGTLLIAEAAAGVRRFSLVRAAPPGE